MRVLYVSYATWKSVVQANSFTIYEHATNSGQAYAVWAGRLDVVYRADVSAADLTDYTTTFPSGRVPVPDEDEALALIIDLATVIDPRTANGTQVFSEQRLTFGEDAFLRTDDSSEAMNVNGLSAGALLNVWNGTGGADTGADWTASGDGSQATIADAGTGTNGWDSGARSANDFTNFSNGSPLDIASLYSSLKFKLKPIAWPGNGQFQIQWRNAASTVIGNTLLIPNYVTNMDLNVWKDVEIPIADFALTESVQSLRIIYKVGNQRHYIDDIKLQASGGGGPYVFQAAAPSTANYHISMLVLVLSGAGAGWNPTTFANIAALSNGLLLRQRRLSTGEILWRFNVRDNTDLFGRFHPQDDITFANGTLLAGFMIKPGKASIVITDDDVVEFVVRDNMSALSSARAYVHYGVEVIG